MRTFIHLTQWSYYTIRVQHSLHNYFYTSESTQVRFEMADRRTFTRYSRSSGYFHRSRRNYEYHASRCTDIRVTPRYYLTVIDISLPRSYYWIRCACATAGSSTSLCLRPTHICRRFVRVFRPLLWDRSQDYRSVCRALRDGQGFRLADHLTNL